MLFDTEFDYILPLGFNCNSANSCKIAGKRKQKLPFDWMQIVGVNNPDKFLSYQKMLQDMINNSLEFNIIKNKTDDFSILNYNAWIPHEEGDDDCEGIRVKYIKYFARLRTILESNKKILVVISELEHVRDYNKNVVEIQKKYLKNLYPNNDYYFLTINIDNHYINTDRHLNVVLNEREGYLLDGVWTAPFLEKSVEVCKNIKLSNTQSITEVINNEA